MLGKIRSARCRVASLRTIAPGLQRGAWVLAHDIVEEVHEGGELERLREARKPSTSDSKKEKKDIDVRLERAPVTP